MKRCAKRFGKHRERVCVRFAGHRGRHSVMLSVRELRLFVRRAA